MEADLVRQDPHNKDDGRDGDEVGEVDVEDRQATGQVFGSGFSYNVRPGRFVCLLNHGEYLWEYLNIVKSIRVIPC